MKLNFKLNKATKFLLSFFIIFLIFIISISIIGENKKDKSKTGILEISPLSSADNIEIDLSKSVKPKEEITFTIKSQSDYKQKNLEDDLIVVSTNPEVATVELNAIAYNTVQVKINGLSAGTTEIFLQTNDTIVKSNTIKVLCTGEITTVPTTIKETTTTKITTEKNTIPQTVMIETIATKKHYTKVTTIKHNDEQQ